MAVARGYTLIELLIVLSILAGLAVAVAPRFEMMRARAEFQASNRALTRKLREARDEAVFSQREVDVEVDVPARRYRRLVRGAAYVQLPPDIELNVVSGVEGKRSSATAVFRFFPDGSSTGGQLRLSSKYNLTVVDVDWLTGVVRHQDEVH